MLSRLVVAAVSALLTLSAAPAQGCTGSTFWKRDTLPDVPTGLTGVSVIAGMCEGESAGVVFEVPAGMSVQRLTQVVAPWGAAGGIPGHQAVLDVEVYDGVSFSGAAANMGTRVFSLSNDLQGNMQVQSHGLNTLDVSTYGIIVGAIPAADGQRRFAVCFRCDINLYPGGACATGWGANFFTDNSQQISFPFTCNATITPQRTSVIEIAGQGWRDPALATVQGIGLCPIYYSGIFCVRCCTEDAFPASYSTFGTGCASSGGAVSHLLPAALPRVGQTMLVNVTNMPTYPGSPGLAIGLMLTGTSNTTSVFGPLPIDMAPAGMPGCMLRVGYDVMDNIVTFGSTGSWSLQIPNQAALLGLQFYQQTALLDPPLNSLGIALSDAAAWQIGN